jgi:hypothetical protein
VIVTGCMGNEAELIRARFPDVLAVTGAHQYEDVVDAVHAAAPPGLGPYVDLIPQSAPGDVKLTRATTAISRFPKAAITPAPSASFRNCAENWQAAGSTRFCARLKSWSRPEPANCW